MKGLCQGDLAAPVPGPSPSIFQLQNFPCKQGFSGEKGEGEEEEKQEEGWLLHRQGTDDHSLLGSPTLVPLTPSPCLPVAAEIVGGVKEQQVMPSLRGAA